MPKTFDDLRLSDRALDIIHKLGWRDPTPVQGATIPHLLTGKDVIARAPTGSGKTGAYGFPLTDLVKGPGVQALVLAPTRELVVQVTDDLNRYAEGSTFRAVAVYGGVPYDPQLADLRDPATTCIVATPGRLLDLLHRKAATLDDVRFLILDEADRMLDFGFLPEVERIIKFVRGDRQTALFSATMPKEVAKLAQKYMVNPREVHPESGASMPATAMHFVVNVPSSTKTATLVALLEAEAPESAIVFVRTRDAARVLEEKLQEKGVPCMALHGDLKQSQREHVFRGFRDGSLRILVATDVAARGLDVQSVTHVINFDPPEASEDYVHRAGRTARAGRPGRIFTIGTEKDLVAIQKIGREAMVRLKDYHLEAPTSAQQLARSEAATAEPGAKKGSGKKVPARYREEHIQTALDLAGARDRRDE